MLRNRGKRDSSVIGTSSAVSRCQDETIPYNPHGLPGPLGRHAAAFRDAAFRSPCRRRAPHSGEGLEMRRGPGHVCSPVYPGGVECPDRKISRRQSRRVVAPRVPRVATKNPPRRPEASPKRTVPPDHLDRVGAARRREPTAGPHQRAQDYLVPANQTDQKGREQPPKHPALTKQNVIRRRRRRRPRRIPA
jgi:hypothetical protein